MGYVGDVSAIGGALHQVMKSRNIYKRTAQLGAGLTVGNMSKRDVDSNGLNVVNGLGMVAGYGSAALGLKGIYNRFSANAKSAGSSNFMYGASKLGKAGRSLSSFSESLSEDSIKKGLTSVGKNLEDFGTGLYDKLVEDFGTGLYDDELVEYAAKP